VIHALVAAAALSGAVCDREFRFSGMTWCALSGLQDDPLDPVTFSASSENVFLDARGRLHLRITQRDGRWYCAEIYETAEHGYGEYQAKIAGPLGALDPNVVAGMFTWNDDPAYADREIDIEYSRWGGADRQNAEVAVQPYTAPFHLARFTAPEGSSSSTGVIRWRQGRVSFSVADFHTTLTHGVPPAGRGTHLHINLWLRGNRPPLSGAVSEIIVDSVSIKDSRQP